MSHPYNLPRTHRADGPGLKRAGIIISLLALACSLSARAQETTLHVQFTPRFRGAPMVFDTLSYTNAAGQPLSVTRLDFLLSDFALRRADGSWFTATNWFASVKARDGQTNFDVGAVPAGQYDRVRFHVGLEPDINHKDPANYPANHPLNPDVNGLYWGWAGGFVFLAVEGGWIEPGGKQGGYSYHLANDPQFMTVELPVALDTTVSAPMQLSLDVDKIFAQPGGIAFDEVNDSTHSRTNDPLALQLCHNVEHAFSASVLPATATVSVAPAAAVHLEIDSNATPYRLVISRFFPRPYLPSDNPLTDQGVALGRRLFNDTRLSINNTQACASCHHAAYAFSDTNAVSLGAEGEPGIRNAMPLLNLAWKSSYFWNGRAPTLRAQALEPVQNPIEMHETWSNVIVKLSADPEYPQQFGAAFGHAEITPDRVGRAIEQFLLAQVSFNSKFDHVIAGADKLTPEEQRGFELFSTEYDPRRGQYGADCFHCHGGPLFQSQSFANNGLDADFKDPGRYTVTGREGDRGKFAVPSLRNVEVTGPYMHDGRFDTLEEVIEHYSTGIKRSATLDPNLAKHPDGGVPLSDADKRALVAFLKTLTDESLKPQLDSTKSANAPPTGPG